MPNIGDIDIDGIATVEGGMDSGNSPLLIGDNQYAYGRDCSVVGGFLRPRPGWREVTRSSFMPGDPIPVAGWFQGGAIHVASNPIANHLLIAVNGRIIQIDPSDNWRVTDLSEVYKVSLSPKASRAYFLQADRFTIINDVASTTLVWDGITLRRMGQGELPGGKMSAYANGRIFQSLSDGRSFLAGDISGGASGTQGFNYKDAVLKVTENTYLAEGGTFAIPEGSGRITCMAVPAQNNSAPEVGLVLILTRDKGFTLNLPVDRTAWADMRHPAMTTTQVGGGCVGDRAYYLANADILYRAPDGIRSLAIAQRQFHSQWINTPISHEMDVVLEQDTPHLLPYASGAYGNRWGFMTCWPRWSLVLEVSGGVSNWRRREVYHDGLAVLQFDPVSSMREPGRPVWEGVWTGYDFLQLLSGELGEQQEVIALTRNDQGTFSVMVNDPTLPFDIINKKIVPIQWAFVTREIFRRGALIRKRLEWMDMAVEDIRTDVSIKISLRPAGVAEWYDWTTVNIKAHSGICFQPATVGSECEIAAVQPGAKQEINIPSPPDTCVTMQKRPVNYGFRWQLRFDVTGFCRFASVRLGARIIKGVSAVECVDSIDVRGAPFCPPNDRYHKQVP